MGGGSLRIVGGVRIGVGVRKLDRASVWADHTTSGLYLSQLKLSPLLKYSAPFQFLCLPTSPLRSWSSSFTFCGSKSVGEVQPTVEVTFSAHNLFSISHLSSFFR